VGVGFSAVGTSTWRRSDALEVRNAPRRGAALRQGMAAVFVGRWQCPGLSLQAARVWEGAEAFLAHARIDGSSLFDVVHLPFGRNLRSSVPTAAEEMQKGRCRWYRHQRLIAAKKIFPKILAAILPLELDSSALDSPALGKSPIKAANRGTRILSRDRLLATGRRWIRQARVAMDGQSFGAYWATTIAILEHAA